MGLTTSARGTVFVHGDLEKPDGITVEIVTMVDIDAADWGGVNLYFPEGWEVTAMTSDRPHINGVQNGLASVWTNGQPSQGGKSWVAVGNRMPDHDPLDADISSLLTIDADYVRDGEPTPSTLDLTIAVGSKDGYIVGPVDTTVSVPLLESYRPPQTVNIHFPVQLEPAATVLTARLEGMLGLKDDYLAVNGRVILWPYGFTLDTSSDVPRVLDADGSEVGRLGGSIVLGGGFVPTNLAKEKAGPDLLSF